MNAQAAHFTAAMLVWTTRMEKGMIVNAEMTAPALIVAQETNMSIILTKRAADEAKRIFKEQIHAIQVLSSSGIAERPYSDHLDPESFFLRVGITAGGCSGFNYSLKFDAEFDETKDTKSEQHGVTVILDKKSALYLDGTSVDYYQDLNKHGFVFENPNAVKTCGCGHSFQA